MQRRTIHALAATATMAATTAIPALGQSPGAAFWWAQKQQNAIAAAEARPKIEVCFVLDTTGSMGGLIEGAKAKIWSIANQLVSATPTPSVRFGLLAYRDRGDNYITRLRDLSEDLDAVYAELQTYQAGGGGDAPESVNQALYEALNRMSWSADDKTLKIIFLVGDAPPHMDYTNDLHFPATCEDAARRGIVINTIQCGNMRETEPIWQEIARRAEGKYAAIGQSGDVQIVNTPMDAELAKLNVEIGKTLVPYGEMHVQALIVGNQARAESAPAAVAADRLSVNSNMGGQAAMREAGAPGGDLIDDVKSGRKKLAEVKDEELPEDLRNLPAEKRVARIDELRQQREQTQQQINRLLRERVEFIQKELAARAKAGGKEGFDQKVNSILIEQAARKNIQLAKNP